MSHAVVVGNGPLSDTNRSEIRQLADDGAVVYRFNDFWNKNFEDNEPVDVHVKKLGMLWSRKKRFPQRGDYPDMKNKTIVNYVRPVFKGCSETCKGLRVKSTGTNMLSRLDADRNVAKIDVYGMNWNFHDKVHSRSEGTVIESCCTKCHIHPTPTEDYLPPPRSENVVVLA